MQPYTDEAAEFFRRITPEEAERFMAVSTHPMRDLVASVVAGRQLLDLGCGKGIRIAELYDPDKYLGVDCSEELVNIAKRDNPRHKFIVSGILDFLATQENKSHEVGLMVAVLEHVPTLETAQRIYAEARRVVKELLVGWHMVPNGRQNLIMRVKADLTEPIWQNRWRAGSFDGAVQVKHLDHAELWTVRD